MTLKTGMQWQDCDPKLSLNMKLERAIAYFESKHKQKPNIVLVNPGAVESLDGQFPSIEIQARKYVQPNYFWLGIGEE